MANTDQRTKLARDARPVKDAPPPATIFVIPDDQVVTNGDLIVALNRANKLLEWMMGYIGRMAPGNYHDCYADLNEHGLFMQRHGEAKESMKYLWEPDDIRGGQRAACVTDKTEEVMICVRQHNLPHDVNKHYGILSLLDGEVFVLTVDKATVSAWLNKNGYVPTGPTGYPTCIA